MADTNQRASARQRLNQRFDLAVVGAGAAGLSMAYGAARLGWSVALIEHAEMGGDCLNYGCVPSKALLHAARSGANWAGAQTRIRAAIAAIAPMDSVARYEGLGATVLRGAARLTAQDTLTVDGVAVSAKRIVLATGSRTRIPAFCAGLPYLTNETIWDLAERPAHLLILGAGPMGCEMAEAFANLGARVTLVGPVLPRESPELVAPVAAALAARGVELIRQRAVGASPGPVLQLADGHSVAGTHLLLATGREVDGAVLGIAEGPQGIRTDAGLRVLGRGRHVYAIGDCADPEGTGKQLFTHVAGMHATLLIRKLVFRLPGKLPATPPVRVVYTEPELAQIGHRHGHRVLEQKFDENDRAVAEGETTGLVRLVLDRRGRLIGAGITCPGAGEMIGLYALAIAQRTKLSALAGLVLPYPTRSQAGTRAAAAYFATRLFAAGPRRLAGLLKRLP
jgi:pyruvate/2-oxoglutarate dehydrogenase complex dihydrolipoamide dehydrogenase (E3) component